MESISWDWRYNKWSWICYSTFFAVWVQIAFFIWSFLAIINVGPNVNALWMYAISYTVIQGVTVLFVMGISTVYYWWNKSYDMDHKHNVSIYMGFWTTFFSYAVTVGISFTWLMRFHSHYTTGNVLTPATTANPANRLYYNVHIISVFFFLVSIYFLTKALIAHCNPRKQIYGEKTSEYTTIDSRSTPMNAMCALQMWIFCTQLFAGIWSLLILTDVSHAVHSFWIFSIIYAVLVLVPLFIAFVCLAFYITGRKIPMDFRHNTAITMGCVIVAFAAAFTIAGMFYWLNHFVPGTCCGGSVINTTTATEPKKRIYLNINTMIFGLAVITIPALLEAIIAHFYPTRMGTTKQER